MKCSSFAALCGAVAGLAGACGSNSGSSGQPGGSMGMASGGSMGSGGSTGGRGTDSTGGEPGTAGASTGSGGITPTGGGGHLAAAGSGGDRDFGTGGVAGKAGPGSAGRNGTGAGRSAGGVAATAGTSGAAGGGSLGIGGAGGTRFSAGCGKTRTLTDGRIDITSAGMSRYYFLHTPSNYDSSHPYRLMIAYHQAGGSAEVVSTLSQSSGGEFQQSNFFSLLPLANNTAIFLAPMGQGSGSGTGWPNQNDVDITFTDDMLAQVENDVCVDLNHVFAYGWSYGGSMSYEVACERPNKFRAVAVYSGGILSPRTPACIPKTPVPYYASHGLGDTGIALGRAARDNFVAANGCTMQMAPEPMTGSGTHICTTYMGCMTGYPVRWCAFDGPHEPGPTDRGQSMSWNLMETWTFFSQF